MAQTPAFEGARARRPKARRRGALGTRQASPREPREVSLGCQVARPTAQDRTGENPSRRPRLAGRMAALGWGNSGECRTLSKEVPTRRRGQSYCWQRSDRRCRRAATPRSCGLTEASTCGGAEPTAGAGPGVRRGKSAGGDGLTTENVPAWPDSVKAVMAGSFAKIINDRGGQWPRTWRECCVPPIPKKPVWARVSRIYGRSPGWRSLRKCSRRCSCASLVLLPPSERSGRTDSGPAIIPRSCVARL